MKKILMVFFALGIIVAISEKNVPVTILCIAITIILYASIKKKPKEIRNETQTLDTSKAKNEPSFVKNDDNYNPKYKDYTIKWMPKFDSVANNFISIDLETTGLSPVEDRIIEISAVYFNNQEPVATFNTLINPGVKIPSSASKINHITNKMIKNAPNEQEAIDSLMTFIFELNGFSGKFVAYNAKFDGKFIDATLHRLGIKNRFVFFDCYKLAKELYNDAANYKLTTIAKELGLSTDGSHRATLDAENCGFVLIESYKKMIQEKIDVFSSFTDYDKVIIEQIESVLNNNPLSVSKDKNGYLRFYNNLDLFLIYRKTKTLSYVLIDEYYCLGRNMNVTKAVSSENGYKRYSVLKDDDLLEISDYIKKEYESVSKKCNKSLWEAIDIYRTTFDF
ncbi:MAG: 3'-5' exonuclease [Eubacteriales bacterium]|nr:3'-5' exonuclease [Eubacteriales bacterium]